MTTPGPRDADYVITSPSDVTLVPEIVAFFRANETEGIRPVDADEVEDLVERGLIFLARARDGRIVATTYLSEQETAAGLLEYEIGGGLVALGHQDCGLITCLGVCAIGSLRLQIPRDMASGGITPAIVGRVEVSNDSPIRKALVALGFSKARTREIDPAGKPGLHLMPRNEHGKVSVEEYEFDDRHLRQRLQEALEYRDAGRLKKTKTVRIDIHALNPNEFRDPLRERLAELDDPHAPPAPPDRR